MNNLLLSLIAHFNIALPIAVLYYYFPAFVLSFSGAITLSFFWAAYVFYLNYAQSKALMGRLQFAPSGDSVEYFNKQIRQAGLDPQKVIMRYGYNDDQLAITNFTMIVIDQMLWKGINDPEFVKAQEVVTAHVLPTLIEPKKRFQAQINEMFTEPVQRFIFKHELGHVADNYGYKKLILMALSAFLSVFSGLCFTAQFITVLDPLTMLLGALLIAATIDVVCPYLINYFFKSYKELEADRFAARVSSKQEIEAAADFFEKYEIYAQECRAAIGDSSLIPLVFRIGYVDGHERVKRLRKLAQGK